MKKKGIKTLTVSCLSVLAVFVCLVSLLPGGINTRMDNGWQDVTNCNEMSGSHEYVEICYENDYILDTNEIEVPFEVHSSDQINGYTYTQKGFMVLSERGKGGKTVVFRLQCVENSDEYEMLIAFRMLSGKELCAKLSIVYNESGIFVRGYAQ